MNSTTTISGYQFDKDLVNSLMNVIDEGTKEFARTAWSWSLSFLAGHWLLVGGIFVAALVLLLIKAALGSWGSLYSLTYWTLYAVVIFIIGMIWGPEALVSDVFHIVYMAAIWPVCYLVTGWIWDRFGFRRKKW
jgi:hypothetical protein